MFSLTPSTEALGPGDALVVTLRSSYPTGSSPSAPLRALGFQAAFGFDPARFRLESIAPIADGPFPLALGTSIDNAAGRAVFSATVSEVDFGNPNAGMTAEAPLATLVFTAIEALPDCTAVGLVAVLPNNGAATPIVTRLTTETASGLRTRIPVATPIVAIRIDDVAPVVVVDGAGAPADIELPMDAGSDFGAFVAEPEIAVTDNCEPEPSVVLAVVFPDGSAAANWPADGMFPVGVTMLRLAADDGAGNETIVEWTITVLPHYLLDLRLGFNSCIESPTTRAIRITGLPVPALASPIVVTFPAWTGSTSNPASVDGLVIPRDAAIGCVAAKDTAATIAPTAYPSHSLTARFGDLVVVGTRYQASVVLFQGDSDDNDRIDIIDYGIFAQDRGAGKPDYARSNFNGDSEVDNGDFGALSVNFFRTGETCSAGALAGEPLSRISLKELRRRGLGHLAGADLNGDGWLDLTDVQLFIEGGGGPAVRPSHSGTERQP